MANRLKFATFVTDYAYETFTQQLIKNACNLRSKSPKSAPVPCSTFSSLPFPSVHLQLWCRKIQMGQLNLQHFYECFVLGENFQGLSGDYGDVVCATPPPHTHSVHIPPPLLTLHSRGNPFPQLVQVAAAAVVDFHFGINNLSCTN